jgi:predicted O-linked N-acetylglucosamine transferase (SPINDLY family)
LTEFVASDFDEYVAIAERWATHLPALALVRAELRERVRRSPLCAAEAFTRHFEQILRDVWRDATRTRPRT